MIFVTGATGFIGRNLVRLLSEEGLSVRALVRDGSKESRVEGLPNVTIARGDVMTPGMVEYAMTGCDTVIHLVGIIRERKGVSFQQMHVQATQNVLEAARKKGVQRFIQMSALGAKANARTAYQRTKWQGEELVRGSEMKWTILRPSVVYGAHSEFLLQMMGLLRAPFTPIVAPAMTRGLLQPIHVDDLTACIARMVRDEKTIEQSYDFGGPNRVTTEALLRTLAELSRRKMRAVRVPQALVAPLMGVGHKLGLPVPVTPEQLMMLRENSICDDKALQTHFGITPRPLREGLRQSLA